MGTAKRIEHVADLITASLDRNIVVLSAMSGTTNSLVEISEYLYKGNVPGAQETIKRPRKQVCGYSVGDFS